MLAVRLSLLAAALGALPISAAGLKPGYHPRASVTAPTRLDWTFVLANQSLTKVPPAWLKDYDSTEQTFELFVPTRREERASLPVLIYLSPGDEPNGMKAFGGLVRSKGFLFAAPRGAGNNVPPQRRIRILLDVLDLLRRDYPIDPDRTYLTGFSGGGRIAGSIAFALPELFGGVMPICAGGFLRDESWLRQRVTDRLRVALLTGETDFNRGEVERLRAPYLKLVGVESRVWTQKGLGHAIPEEKVLAEAVAWLEKGLPARQKLAKSYPASRLSSRQDSSREVLARALLDEGKKRLEAKGSRYPGLMQLKGVLERWPDTAPAREARTILLAHEEKPDRPWEADDVAEQRKFLLAQARATDGYATGPLPPQYARMQPDMKRQALEYWELLLKDQPRGAIAEEAKKRIAALKKDLGD